MQIAVIAAIIIAVVAVVVAVVAVITVVIAETAGVVRRDGVTVVLGTVDEISLLDEFLISGIAISGIVVATADRNHIDIVQQFVVVVAVAIVDEVVVAIHRGKSTEIHRVDRGGR